MHKPKAIGFVLAVLVLGLTAAACATAIVDEDFSGTVDPLAYWYQDDSVSTDSFSWSDANDNVWGTARRGQHGGTLDVGTAERAVIDFDAGAAGCGSDQYLDYTEDFDFSFDFNFSSFASSANDERVIFGVFTSPEDIEVENATFYDDWANRSHTIGAMVEEDGSEVRFYYLFGNGGDWVGKAKSDDLTGTSSLTTGVDYRLVGHYRYDGTAYAQVYGELWQNDGGGWTLVGSIAQETVTQNTPDIYSVAYANPGAVSTQRFLQASQLGIGNETWGTTRESGAEFTTDNWYLGCTEIPEPATIGLLLTGLGAFALRWRRK